MKLLRIILLFLLLLNAFNSYAQKVELVDYTLYPCEEYYIDLWYLQERIIDVSLSTDTLTVLVSTKMNCASGEKANIHVQADTIYLYSDSPDSIPIIDENNDTISWDETESADCTCCFTLEYKIKGVLSTNYVISMNRNVLKQLPNKYILPTINDFGDTTAFFDTEGYFHKRTYNLLGELRFERKENADYSNVKMYYRNGQLRREEEFDKANRIGKIREYNESGDLIVNETYNEH
jgi:hypothetical protein